MKIVLTFLTLFNCLSLFGQRILIVDIGHRNRTDVGIALSIISNHHPKIIGIDVLYVSDSLQSDTTMARSISKLSNVVMSAQLHYFDAPYSFWDSLELPNDKFRAKYIGFSNIYTEDSQTIPEIPIQESYKGKLLPSFSYEVARRSDSRLQFLNSARIKISKSKIGNYYPILSLSDILAGKIKKEEVENNIVLFGFLGQEFKVSRRSKKKISGVELQACFIEYLIKNYSN